MTLWLGSRTTPFGPVFYAVRGGTLVAMTVGSQDLRDATVARRFPDEQPHRPPADDPVAAALEAYADGDVRALDTLPVDHGGTGFRGAAWNAMRTIEPATTISYTELAKRCDSPHAVRAAGSACATNPIWLAIPCHRVVRSDGSLGGYGGGLDRKQALLSHERKHA